MTYFCPIRHQKALNRSHEIRGTTERNRIPERSPTP